MKNFITLLSISLLVLFSGCTKVPKKAETPPLHEIKPPIDTPPITAPEINNSELPPEVFEEELVEEVVEPILIEEPFIEEQEPIVEMIEMVETEDDPYDTYLNDEHISDGKASKIVVVKSKRILVLFDENNKVLSRHKISLGKNTVGTKLKQGDYKTPEGTYKVVTKGRDKRYYKEILISYPNEEDKKRSKALGFNPGGGITIHAQVPWNWNGKGDDYTLNKDWTQGCMAMTNKGIDMIWNCVSPNTVVEIRE